ncbi:MAG TPA: APC family permease [Vicinamibacteria bacterium]|nr:APC family permease [Vicinamibacteria bacterium]
MSGPPSLPRVLGRADLVLFSVSAILTIDSLASAASMGVSWFTWWGITMALFFVPYGLITAELGSAWPSEGGLYVWVREALGPRWGSQAAWLYWINNAYWIPSVYMVFAATFHAIFLLGVLPPALREGPGATWLQAGIAIAVTWATVLVGLLRLKVSKWLPNVGAVVKTAIFLGLGALGLQSLLSGRPPANDFALSGFVPRWSDSLAFLPVLVYNALGFELMSSAGDEMKDPQRDVPRVVLLSGVLIAIVYTLGVAGILLAVPLGELSLVTGTWDALQVLGPLWGEAGDLLVVLLGIGFLYACIANIVTWSLGVNRVAAAASLEGTLPSLLGRIHPRFGTPYMAFLVMGAVSTLLLLGNALLSDQPSNLFWMTFKLSGICFLLSYLLLFPAFLVLRYRRPHQPRPYRLGGGLPVAWVAAVVCWLFIAMACALFFKPSPTALNPALAVRESWILLAETLVTIAAGWLLMPKRPRSE